VTERRSRRQGSLGGRAAGATIRKHKPDYRIALYMGLLMMLGLIVMYAIGPQRAQVLNTAYGTEFYSATYFFGKQAISLGLSVIVFAIVAKVPLQWWKNNAKRIFMISLAASAVLAIGGWFKLGFVQCSLGACRWFDLGPFSLQPAELMKFGLLLFGAGFIAYRAQQGLLNDLYKSLIPMVAILLTVALFVIGIQKDMGTGLVILAIMTAMLLVGGISLKVGAVLLSGLIAFGSLMILIAPHRISRVTTFLQGDAASVSDAGAYHIEHAKIAIGSGGFNGVGIGNSVQATGYLPEAINDSVFAIMGETFGFVGLVIVLLLFSALLLGLLRTAERLNGMYEKLIVVGVFGWLASHVVLNVAAMTGVFPLTGITLPLLSFGGTSMVFIAGALGLAFQLSSYTVHSTVTEGDRYENSHGRRGVGRPRYASRSRM
jgi:cell division protein FtsW